ncbi:hypothetical protein [Paenibacillus glufosinatiresistens]|uniref:hypothetical protein n=1 Tax=Paenibacillus glufosinatiresistens TaxID=3070657 RepID=UPI00286EA1E4|nr:hypothetical protein [Paenibacillus sp. YX.27]
MSITKAGKKLVAVHNAGFKVVNEKLLDPEGNLIPIIKPNNGYPFAVVEVPNQGKILVKLHRLLCYQLYGDKMFKKGYLTLHNDDDKNNLQEENIKIGTQKDNIRDWKRNKLRKSLYTS